MNRPFPAGTIVYLKSGSPPLTVSDLGRADDVVNVEWFAGSKVERDAFHKDCLTQEAPWVPNAEPGVVLAKVAQLARNGVVSEGEGEFHRGFASACGMIMAGLGISI